MLSSNKLAAVIGKWCKLKSKRLDTFCNLNAIENDCYFLIDCENSKKLRESTTKSISDTEHSDLSQGNITKKKLRKLFSNRFDCCIY